MAAIARGRMVLVGAGEFHADQPDYRRETASLREVTATTPLLRKHDPGAMCSIGATGVHSISTCWWATRTRGDGRKH